TALAASGSFATVSLRYGFETPSDSSRATYGPYTFPPFCAWTYTATGAPVICLREASNRPKPMRFTPGWKSDSVSARAGALGPIERASCLNCAGPTDGNLGLAITWGAVFVPAAELEEEPPPPPLPQEATPSAASSSTPPRGRVARM